MATPEHQSAAPPPWTSLFDQRQPSSAETKEREFLVFRKAGEPLLVIPHGVRAAARALDLFPAQTFRARLAKAVWRGSLQLGLPINAERVRVRLDSAQPFLRFLKQVAGTSGVPEFALMAGNPRAPGRRFLVLVFGASGEPTVVVKAGSHRQAAELLDKEAGFLTGAPPSTLAIPKVSADFREAELRAFAMDFIDGVSPGLDDVKPIEPILNAWLAGGGVTRVEDIPVWRRLAQASADDPAFRKIGNKLASSSARAVLFHGDLAPWNIKVSANGVWTVLDWERGELQGPPAWDWFHFILQPAILVRKLGAPKLAEIANGLLESAAFRSYAQAAGISGQERDWLLAYLFHCRDVIRPAEGLPPTRELLNLLSRQWLDQ